MADRPTTTTVLVTGANRGIGKALVATYLLRPGHTVVAAVRTPETAAALQQLPRHAGATLLTATIDAADHASARAAVATLQAQHGLAALDCVYANAGISEVYPTAAAAALDDLRRHFEVNTLGALALFQAVRPLLQASAHAHPRFVAVSSSAGSIGGMERRNVPNAAYGTSKAALNYLIRKVHFEHETLTALAVDPGWVRTDMGNRAAEGLGLAAAETSIEESVAGVVRAVDAATRATSGGKFLLFSGGEYPW